MCGRYVMIEGQKALQKLLGPLLVRTTPAPHYNIAPTQNAPVIFGEGGAAILDLFRWGLIPAWAQDMKIGNRLINARADTILEKPSFRSAIRKRRCLVPANGFYEWKHEGKIKIPHLIQCGGGEPFMLAGIWEEWKDAEGQLLRSFAIITTEANSLLKDIHDRMPVILPGEAYKAWLDPTTPMEQVVALLKPFASERMNTFAVDRLVNSPSNDTPACIVPASFLDRER